MSGVSADTLAGGAARAVLVGVESSERTAAEADALLDELGELVKNLGIEVACKHRAKIRAVDSPYFVGRGKMAQIVGIVSECAADVVVVDVELSPAQQRNWELETGVSVVNRQEVILDIFAMRARTREARLQVELAKLEYSLPRLRRAWSHLDRQRGGGVTQRGGGESQLELDRRFIRARIAKLKAELQQVRVARGIQRARRMRVPVPSAAVVGYTNAGKSSLINLLTASNLFAEDKLFATLDPSTRRVLLPNGRTLLLTDTVGFVRNLPHRFVEAFKATLEEALVSDFLVHVVDSSSPDAEEHIKTTLKVLEELGADKKRILTVFNKTDIPSENSYFLHAVCPDAVWMSVKNGDAREILERLAQMSDATSSLMTLRIPHSEAAVIAKVHELCTVENKVVLDDAVEFRASVPVASAGYFGKWSV